MAQFYIYKKDTHHDLEAVGKVFSNMQLKQFEEFETNTHVIRFYSSLRTKKIYRHQNALLLINGPVLYKNHDLDGSGTALIKDLISGNVSWEEVTGSFALVFVSDNNILIHNDSLGVYRLFANTAKTFVSTSFLATVFASPSPLQVNHFAVKEKICHGFILYPETLVKEVKDITYENIKQPDFQKIYRSNPEFQQGDMPAGRQAVELKKYFQRYLEALNGQPVSLGLSAGFDSRLLLSNIIGYTPKYLFTHSTGAVHNKEKQVAAKLCELTGEKLNILPTEKPEKLSDQEELAMLDDLLFYYDGRTANNSGAYSLTGTFTYNHAHLQHATLGLNGKGGEVYRNYYNLPPFEVSYNNFYDLHVAYSSTSFVLNEQDAQELKEYFCNSVRNRISDWGNKVSKWSVQRYYSEVRQPDCEGSIITAHNKVTDYLAPFLDSSLLKISYNSFQQLGLTDQFQANLIRELSPELAAVQSKYGYNFARRNFKDSAKSGLSVFLPLSIKKGHLQNYFKKAVERKQPLNERESRACAILESFVSSVNWRNAFIHYAQKNVAMYLAHFFRMASGKLKN